MKGQRIYLSLFAFVLAVGGAAASKMIDITTHGKRISGPTVYSTVESSCDNDLPSGQQCRIMVGGQSEPAFQVANQSKPLYRP
jgi:hypothetical protein